MSRFLIIISAFFYGVAKFNYGPSERELARKMIKSSGIDLEILELQHLVELSNFFTCMSLAWFFLLLFVVSKVNGLFRFVVEIMLTYFAWEAFSYHFYNGFTAPIHIGFVLIVALTFFFITDKSPIGWAIRWFGNGAYKAITFIILLFGTSK